jgi:hypothetical protein
LEAAHIVGQKNINVAIDRESVLLDRFGLDDVYQVQNGLFLCSSCHGLFDFLQQYVDEVEGVFVLKIINMSKTNDKTSDEHKNWEARVETFKDARKRWQPSYVSLDERNVPVNEELVLHFFDNDPLKFPNKKAVAFHKAACLIWRMAGGADLEDVESFQGDDDTDGKAIPAFENRSNVETATNSFSQPHQVYNSYQPNSKGDTTE